MNELRIFENPEFGKVRTVTIDGEYWFVGRDVALALGYGKGNSESKALSNAIADHVDTEDKMRITANDLKGTCNGDLEINSNYGIIAINESGLYSMIMGSRLPSAKRFKHWVTSEVLPALVRTGEYKIQERPDSYMIDDPVERAERWIEEQREKKALENKVALLEPDASAFQALCDSKLLTNFRDAAKELGISQSQFIGWLKREKYIYSTSKGELRPMEAYRSSDLFQMKSYINPYNGFSGIRTYLTPKGLQYFKMQFEARGIIPDALPKHGGRKKWEE